jgi:Selenoprotein, putative
MKRLRKAAAIVLDTLREIFDEAAYARYLDRHNLTSSPQAYENFWREREAVHARRTRCC